MKTSSDDPLNLTTTALSMIQQKSVVIFPHKSVSIFEIRSPQRRLFVSIVLASAALLLPFSNSLYLPSLAHIEHDLHASTVLVDYTISGYLIAAGIANLLWGPLSDRFGRKIILLIALISYICFTILCNRASNIILLLIFRSLQGASISAPLVIGQSAMVDMYPPDRLGFAMSIFLVPFLIGPIPGPFIGGALSNTFGWRSIFISLVIMAVVSIILILLLVPETHHYFVLQRLLQDANKKCKEMNKTFVIEANSIFRPSFMPPWRPFLFLSDLTIVPYLTVCNINFSALLITFTLMSNQEAQYPYFLSPMHIGLSYIPSGVFSLIGSLIGGLVSDWSAKRFPQAIEGRLIFSLIGSSMCPLGLLLCGWTFHFGVHVPIPLIGTVMIALGDSFMSTSTCAFVNIKKPAVAGSILALFNALNLTCAGIGIIIAVPLLTLIDLGPLFSILAGISLTLIGVSLVIVLRQLRGSHSRTFQRHTSSHTSESKINATDSKDTILVQRF